MPKNQKPKFDPTQWFLIEEPKNYTSSITPTWPKEVLYKIKTTRQALHLRSLRNRSIIKKVIEQALHLREPKELVYNIKTTRQELHLRSLRNRSVIKKRHDRPYTHIA